MELWCDGTDSDSLEGTTATAARLLDINQCHCCKFEYGLQEIMYVYLIAIICLSSLIKKQAVISPVTGLRM